MLYLVSVQRKHYHHAGIAYCIAIVLYTHLCSELTAEGSLLLSSPGLPLLLLLMLLLLLLVVMLLVMLLLLFMMLLLTSFISITGTIVASLLVVANTCVCKVIATLRLACTIKERQYNAGLVLRTTHVSWVH
jgi:hypothetical protein